MATATIERETVEIRAVAAQDAPEVGLRLLGHAARFRRLSTALERARVDAARNRAHARLDARYPAASRDPMHDDREIVDALRIVHAGYAPLIRAAWDGDDEPPTAEALEAADPAELDACLDEVLRLNPFLGAARPN